MAKKYSTTLKETLAEKKRSYASEKARLEAAAAQFAFADNWVALLPKSMEAYVGSYLSWNDNVVVYLRVDSFKDFLAELTTLEANGYSIDETEDNPSWGERVFRSKANGIEVKCRLHGDGQEGCKRIIVGYKEPAPAKPQPIYAFECTEGTITPAPDVNVNPYE